MKKIKIYYLLLPFLVLINRDAFAQSYKNAFKFNYGVFLYNDVNSQAIKQPLDAPFSLGLQYQSNLSKAFTNSIGANVYRWSTNGAKNESFSFQDILFLRNNAMLFNRLKPQFGFGLGFEERKTTINAQNNFSQFVFIPVNVGFQTDLSEQLAIGIFGEIRYGFDLNKFNINNGKILPNNTAGVSLAYRFGRVKENKNFTPINWNVSEAELITLDNLKAYLDTTQTNNQIESKTVKQVNVSVKTIDSLALDRDSTLSINSKLNTVSYNDVSGLDSNKNLKVKINQQEKLENKPILSRNNFKLSDFKENTTVVYVDTIVKNTLRTQTQVVPQAKTVTRIDTVYVNNNNGKAQTQKVYSEQKPPEIIYRDNTNTNSSTKTTTETTKIKEKEIVDAASFGLITTQMAQLLSMQQETNRLLQNQQNGVQIKPVVAQVTYNQKLDSLALKVALFEQRLLTMDSLLRIANSQKSNNSTKPIVKENLLIVQDKTPNKGKETTSDKPIVVKQDTPATNKVNDTSTIDCIITYPINQSDLSDVQRNLISSQIVNEFNKSGSNFVLLEAYTDSSGNPIYNKKLSDLRINKVINFLTVNGIAKEKILTKNFGEEKSQEKINPEERKIIFKIIKNGK